MHDWKTVDLAGVPLTKSGNAAIGKLLLETQADRILYIEIENPEALNDFGAIFVSFLRLFKSCKCNAESINCLFYFILDSRQC